MEKVIIRNQRSLEFQVKDKLFVGSSPFTFIKIKEDDPDRSKSDGFGNVFFYPDYIGDPDIHENSFRLVVNIKQPLKDGLKERHLSCIVELRDSDIRAMAELVDEWRGKYRTVKKEVEITDKRI